MENNVNSLDKNINNLFSKNKPPRLIETRSQIQQCQVDNLKFISLNVMVSRILVFPFLGQIFR